MCVLALALTYSGYVEARTGLEMINRLALGECFAAALARSRTMEALVLNRSA